MYANCDVHMFNYVNTQRKYIIVNTYKQSESEYSTTNLLSPP